MTCKSGEIPLSENIVLAISELAESIFYHSLSDERYGMDRGVKEALTILAAVTPIADDALKIYKAQMLYLAKIEYP